MFPWKSVISNREKKEVKTSGKSMASTPFRLKSRLVSHVYRLIDAIDLIPCPAALTSSPLNCFSAFCLYEALVFLISPLTSGSCFLLQRITRVKRTFFSCSGLYLSEVWDDFFGRNNTECYIRRNDVIETKQSRSMDWSSSPADSSGLLFVVTGGLLQLQNKQTNNPSSPLGCTISELSVHINPLQKTRSNVRCAVMRSLSLSWCIASCHPGSCIIHLKPIWLWTSSPYPLMRQCSLFFLLPIRRPHNKTKSICHSGSWSGQAGEDWGGECRRALPNERLTSVWKRRQVINQIFKQSKYTQALIVSKDLYQ